MDFYVKEEDKEKRLDSFLAENNTAEYTRSYIGKLIEEGYVLYNGQKAKASIKLKSGDHISLIEKEAEVLDVKGEDIPLDIVFEDEDLLVVNKPRGMVVHPAPGHYTGTLVNAVIAHSGTSLSSINGVLRPGIIHRIDKDTSGLLLICKNDLSHKALAKQLEEHTITRRYHALCFGRLKEESGTISAPIGRDEKDRKRQIEKLRSICPKCGNKHTARIIYGMPMMDEEMEKAEAEGRIWLGGCCLEDYRYYCNNCELKF
mgnify:FL=1